MIRKAIIKDVPKVSEWMDLATLARLEITSEDPEHPIEFALNANSKFWRAAEDGEQTIRVYPTLHRIFPAFHSCLKKTACPGPNSFRCRGSGQAKLLLN